MKCSICLRCSVVITQLTWIRIRMRHLSLSTTVTSGVKSVIPSSCFSFRPPVIVITCVQSPSIWLPTAEPRRLLILIYHSQTGSFWRFGLLFAWCRLFHSPSVSELDFPLQICIGMHVQCCINTFYSLSHTLDGLHILYVKYLLLCLTGLESTVLFFFMD